MSNYSWATLEAGMERIMTRLRDGIDMKTYMDLYTAVHNFCTSQKGLSHSSAISGGSAQRGGTSYSGLVKDTRAVSLNKRLKHLGWARDFLPTPGNDQDLWVLPFTLCCEVSSLPSSPSLQPRISMLTVW